MRRGLIVIAVIFLAACHVDTTVDIHMRSDGSGTITVTAIADADVVNQAPGLADDLRFDDAAAAGWTLTGPTSTADGGLQVALDHPFASPEEATALLASINGTGGPLHGATLGRAVKQGGTTITFAGSLRIDGLAAFADPDVLKAIGATPYAEQVVASNASPSEAVRVTVKAEFPGSIKSATGTVKDGSVSWLVPLDGSQVDLSTTAADDHATARIWGVAANVALIALIGWCIVAAAFITWVVKARQRRSRGRAPRAEKHPPRTDRIMSKLRLVYRCTSCATTSPKWAGCCPSCAAWNSMVEDVEGADPDPDLASLIAAGPSAVAMPLAEVESLIGGPRSTHIGELDRVLGGGLVPGSVSLLAGEPGIGKSTLLLQLAAAWPGCTLYVSAEESAQQVRLRAERLGAVGAHVWLLAETSLAHIIAALDTVQPQLVIIDSIQSVCDHELGSAAGSVVQVRGCAHRLVTEAKSRGIPMVLVGHVTKDGGIAGPRVLEHVVDTVLSFEGDRHHALRLLRAAKHRFGSTNELGVFEMVEQGLVGVPDASRLFLTDRRPGIAGSAVTPTLEGHRPLMVEVQALTNRVSPGAPPRRSAQGLDPGRLALLLAVLERRARLQMARHEVFASVVGGVRLSEPGSDLPMCLAIVSALADYPLSTDLISFGEVGLAGELRQVAHASRRLAEAARLGFTRAIVPANSANGVEGITLIRAATLNEALMAAGLQAARGK